MESNVSLAPKVSVIIAMYNASPYIEQCINSISLQTLTEIEIICVDDHSSDGTVNIVNQLMSNDKRIQLIQLQKNIGAGGARNVGLTIAKGKYLSFLDADDMFHCNMLQHAYEKAFKHDLDVVVFKSSGFDHLTGEYISIDYSIRSDLLPESDVFSPDDVNKDFFHLYVWWAWDKLFKREHITKQNIQFQEIRTTNDLLFTVKAIITAKKISCLDEVLVWQRQKNPDSLSNTRNLSYNCCLIALREVQKFLEINGLYSKYKDDFQNYAVAFCFWHLTTIQNESFIPLYDDIAYYFKNNVQCNVQCFYYPHLRPFYCEVTTLSAIEYLFRLKDSLSKENMNLMQEVSNLKTAIAEKETKITMLEKINNRLINEINALYSSKSWRITHPLRLLSSYVKRC
ncbi:glycosyltransferase [Salmonella enterica]|uniref:glycosyltransferase n=1 Tax=Salmonella enterica TaxID=28901 RepID=UPI00193CB810|nr:glycosyltransferase [Salmonella enterica]